MPITILGLGCLAELTCYVDAERLVEVCHDVRSEHSEEVCIKYKGTNKEEFHSDYKHKTE